MRTGEKANGGGQRARGEKDDKGEAARDDSAHVAGGRLTLQCLIEVSGTRVANNLQWGRETGEAKIDTPTSHSCAAPQTSAKRTRLS